MPSSKTDATRTRNLALACSWGLLIGTLGGLIGLGSSEFRLPVLLGPFRFRVLEAVILNKAMSLIVVASALPFRTATVPLSAVAASWPVLINLLAGSLLGAWCGAGWAARLSAGALYCAIAAMLVLVAVALLFGRGTTASGALLTGTAQIVAGFAAGFAIGIMAAVMGVAGGELLIPTLIPLLAWT